MTDLYRIEVTDVPKMASSATSRGTVDLGMAALTADSETAYLRRRLREIETEVRAYWKQIVLDALRESLDRRARHKILKELGFDA